MQENHSCMVSSICRMRSLLQEEMELDSTASDEAKSEETNVENTTDSAAIVYLGDSDSDSINVNSRLLEKSAASFEMLEDPTDDSLLGYSASLGHQVFDKMSDRQYCSWEVIYVALGIDYTDQYNGDSAFKLARITVYYNDIRGVAEIQDELKEIVHYLRDPKRCTRLSGLFANALLFARFLEIGNTLLARVVTENVTTRMLLQFPFDPGSDNSHLGYVAKMLDENPQRVNATFLDQVATMESCLVPFDGHKYVKSSCLDNERGVFDDITGRYSFIVLSKNFTQVLVVHFDFFKNWQLLAKSQISYSAGLEYHVVVLSIVGLQQDEVDQMVSAMKIEKSPSELYADFGGLDVQIQEITKVIECPLTQPKLFEDVGFKPHTEIILFGKTEVGKTMFAKPVAQPCKFFHLPATKAAKDDNVFLSFRSNLKLFAASARKANFFDLIGNITYIALVGQHSMHFIVLELEFQGAKKQITVLQTWLVHTPWPVAIKLATAATLITGQRVLETLFPSVLAGFCAMLSAFGCGKNVASQALAKRSNLDNAIYVGCGESGNEMKEKLMDFPQLTTLPQGREESIMKRTTLVANISNMSVAAHEASIYTGASIAEYFRYMGYNVGMIADSTSRWAEALSDAGVISRAVIFAILDAQSAEYNMKLTLLELYNEELTDLLALEEFPNSTYDKSKKSLALMENRKDETLVRGIDEGMVCSENEISNILEKGSVRRHTTETAILEAEHVLTLFPEVCMRWGHCNSGKSNSCRVLGLGRKGVMELVNCDGAAIYYHPLGAPLTEAKIKDNIYFVSKNKDDTSFIEILLARECENDIARFTFWLSYSLVLTATRTNFHAQQQLSFSIENLLEQVVVKDLKKQFSPFQWEYYSNSGVINGVCETLGSWEYPVAFVIALERTTTWISFRIIESIWWHFLILSEQFGDAKTICHRASSSIVICEEVGSCEANVAINPLFDVVNVKRILLCFLRYSNLEDKVLFEGRRNVINLAKVEDPCGNMSNYLWDSG